MRNSSRRPAFMLLIISMLATIALTPVTTLADGPTLTTAIDGNVVTGINALRVQNGLEPLVIDPALTAVANERATDQVARHYYAHVTPDGTTVADLLNAANIPWTNVGENLARGPVSDSDESSAHEQAVAAAIVDAFWQSPSHQANLLDAGYHRVGVASALGEDGQLIPAADFTN